ncbi:MAG: enoyl-CoA hydratase [Gammaproteobacteria bacterium]|nr:enoyl-CoA hydratase [Gammaproteobacteria bacterium]|tara:strand:- start:1244 stop:2194 length:951 start_codon:yes stop_codon:yes gene_type:complete
MAEQNQDDETLEELEIRSASWYQKKLAYSDIIYEVNEDTHVATITLNRPEKMNAMSHQLRAELFHALKHSDLNKDINVIVIKGAGRCFTAGYDLTGMGSDEPDLGSQFVDTSGVTHWARYVVQQWFQIWDLGKVVIGQLHGYALAGGSELASMCDLLVSTPDCQIGYPPMRSMGVDMLWFPWNLPMRKAMELAVTGDSMTGEEAYRLGMVNYCVDQEDIDEFTAVFAERVALMNWQLATQYKRATKKAYEIQGIRTALDGQALFAYHRVSESDFARDMAKKFGSMPLKEYLNLRDDPYKENKARMDEILARQKKGD